MSLSIELSNSFDIIQSEWMSSTSPKVNQTMCHSQVPTEIDSPVPSPPPTPPRVAILGDQAVVLPRRVIPETPMVWDDDLGRMEYLSSYPNVKLSSILDEELQSLLTQSPTPSMLIESPLTGDSARLASPSTIPLMSNSPSSPLPSLGCVTSCSNVSALQRLELSTCKDTPTPMQPNPSVLGKRSLEPELTLKEPEEVLSRTVTIAPKKRRAKKEQNLLNGENSQTKVCSRLPIFMGLTPQYEYLGSLNGVLETYGVTENGVYRIVKRFIPSSYPPVSIPLD